MNQLFINDREIELSPGQVVALSSQINTLSDLKDHNSNLSNRIKVPKSNANIAALEVSDAVQSPSFFPYRRNRARLIMDGVPVVQNGYAVIESAAESFVITVYSGNVDFFDLIDKIKLSDLNLSALNHSFDFSTVINSIAYTEADGYKYPIVNYGQLGNGLRELNPADLRLFFFCSYLFKKIITEQGFTFDGGFFTFPLFQSLIVSGNNENQQTQYYDKLGRVSPGERFDLVSGSPPFNENLVELLAGETWTVTVRVRFQIQSWNPGSSAFGWSYLSGNIYDHALGANSTGAFTITVTSTEVGPLQDAFIVVFHDCTGFTTAGEITFRRTGSASPEMFIHIGDTGFISCIGGDAQMYIAFDFKTQYDFTAIDVSKELPDITQKDFVKAIGHIFGLMFRTSVTRNKIYIKRFSEIVEAIPLAVDWTYKMDMKEDPTLEYRIGGYSQNNLCAYKADDSDTVIPKDYGNGKFTIDDQTLQSEQVAIQLPFAASLTEKKLVNLNVASVRRIDDATGEWNKTTAPRILFDQVETISSGGGVVYDDTDNPPTSISNIPLPWFAREDKANNLKFSNSILNDNYDSLTTILNKSKRITALFKLTPVDIYKFTEGDPLIEGHFIPVYLHQFAAYFYVAKIINYVGGGLTKAELIRIGTEDRSLINACYNEFYPGESFPDDTGWTYDGAISFLNPGIYFDATVSNPMVASFNTYGRLKPNKCYKLIISYQVSDATALDMTVKINGAECILTKTISGVVTPVTAVIGHFSINQSLKGDFLTIIIDSPSGVALSISSIKIVSCDCTDYD